MLKSREKSGLSVGLGQSIMLCNVNHQMQCRALCRWRSSGKGKAVHSRRGACTQVGFTLLELLVVMLIIGLLASFVAPRYFNQVGKSEIKATRAQLDAFDKALAAYRLDTGHYPSTEQGLKALVERLADEPKWSGPYLAKALPSDPWGRAYVYRTPGDSGRDYDMLSYGKDGQRGGTGENADISVWDAGR